MEAEDRSDTTRAGARGFSHERLVVYQKSLELYKLVFALARRHAARDVRLADQLRRAAASIPLNIAEGAGEYRSREKARFYRMALRSATECAAILDLLRLETTPDSRSPSPTPALHPDPTPLLSEIVAMLTRLATLRPSP